MDSHSHTTAEHPVFTRREEKHLKRLQARIDILAERLKSAVGSAALDATLELSAIGWAMETVKILLTEARTEAVPSDKAAPGYVRGLEDAARFVEDRLGPYKAGTKEFLVQGIRALKAAHAAQAATPQVATDTTRSVATGSIPAQPAEPATPSSKCPCGYSWPECIPTQPECRQEKAPSARCVVVPTREQLAGTLATVREKGLRACAIALASIGTYGARDENGLKGYSRDRYDEVCQLETFIRAAG